MDSPPLCIEGPFGNMSPSVGERSRRERQKQDVIPPSVLFHEPKLCLLIFCFSVNGLPCIFLLTPAMWKYVVCWWRRMYTSPRGKGAAALGALAIFLSLPALQPRQNCTPSRHRTKHDRRCCIPWQHRRAAMTPPHPSISKPRLKAVTLPPPS
jgi:hypothetical protein